jgi:hypothetical protein
VREARQLGDGQAWQERLHDWSELKLLGELLERHLGDRDLESLKGPAQRAGVAAGVERRA